MRYDEIWWDMMRYDEIWWDMMVSAFGPLMIWGRIQSSSLLSSKSSSIPCLIHVSGDLHLWIGLWPILSELASRAFRGTAVLVSVPLCCSRGGAQTRVSIPSRSCLVCLFFHYPDWCHLGWCSTAKNTKDWAVGERKRETRGLWRRSSSNSNHQGWRRCNQVMCVIWTMVSCPDLACSIAWRSHFLWAIITPDGDVYEEEMPPHNRDLGGFM